MRMKKILLYFIVAVLIVLPAVASASWWNPFSWFAKRHTTPVVQVQNSTEIPKITDKSAPLNSMIKVASTIGADAT